MRKTPEEEREERRGLSDVIATELNEENTYSLVCKCIDGRWIRKGLMAGLTLSKVQQQAKRNAVVPINCPQHAQRLLLSQAPGFVVLVTEYSQTTKQQCINNLLLFKV